MNSLAGPDLGLATLLLAAVAASIGLVRGFRRELVTLVITGLAAFTFSQLWPLTVLIVNRLWRLFEFAVVERGILAEDPTLAWSSVRGQPPLLPLSDGAGPWQISFFIVAVLALGYGGSRWVTGGPPRATGLGRAYVILERIAGALVGAATGLFIAHFVLPRLVPGAKVSILRPESAFYADLAPFGPAFFLIAITLVLLMGWSGIRGSKPTQREFQ